MDLHRGGSMVVICLSRRAERTATLFGFSGVFVKCKMEVRSMSRYSIRRTKSQNLFCQRTGEGGLIVRVLGRFQA